MTTHPDQPTSSGERPDPVHPGTAEPPTVFAAGGVVHVGEGGRVLVLVTHRPRYDDWSLPKGKRDRGETDEECAIREVLEETGVHVELGIELTPARYRDHKDRSKLVRYWLMRPLDAPTGGPRPSGADRGRLSGHGPIELPAFVPNDEVDEVRWLPGEEAAALVSYDHDRLLIAEAVELLGKPVG